MSTRWACCSTSCWQAGTRRGRGSRTAAEHFQALVEAEPPRLSAAVTGAEARATLARPASSSLRRRLGQHRRQGAEEAAGGALRYRRRVCGGPPAAPESPAGQRPAGLVALSGSQVRASKPASSRTGCARGSGPGGRRGAGAPSPGARRSGDAKSRRGGGVSPRRVRGGRSVRSPSQSSECRHRAGADGRGTRSGSTRPSRVSPRCARTCGSRWAVSTPASGPTTRPRRS